MATLPADPSLLLNGGVITLAVLLTLGIGAFLRSGRVALLSLIWLAVSGLIGASGFLTDFTAVPPRVMLVFVPVFIAVFLLARSAFGKQLVALPLAVLVGYQAFRIVVEILIHQAAIEGVAPPQMSWSGMNFDIVTGVTAAVFAPFANKLPRWALLAWNTMGLGLLLWVVGVAIVSFPTAFQQLTPDNVWVAFFPFVWIPLFFVPLALLGHLAVYKKLLQPDYVEQPV